jgi:hyperosmotically inducible protein
VAALAVCLAALLGACKKGPDDAALTTSVKSQLSSQSPALASIVNVETKDGVVTLNGTVDNDSAKDQAEQAAKSVPNVKSVVNNLTVKPPIAVSKDPKIKSSVEEGLAKYNVKGVTATVSDGQVTLTGENSAGEAAGCHESRQRVQAAQRSGQKKAMG